MLCLLISLGSLYNHLIFTLQNAPVPVPQTVYQPLEIRKTAKSLKAIS